MLRFLCAHVPSTSARPMFISRKVITTPTTTTNLFRSSTSIYRMRIPTYVVRHARATHTNKRFFASGGHERQDEAAAWRRAQQYDRMCYVIGLAVLAIGVSFASVPLYRAFCQATGLGGTTMKADDFEKIEKMKKCDQRLIRVLFNADTHSSMRWNFKPQQTEIWVNPGETALAFYTAMNPTNKPIVGISTYNIVPFDAGLYFAKIQCFCFEEQILNPGEQVDMPVFFYIDPDYVEDPKLENVDEIMLSYTFFESKAGLQLPHPLTGPVTVNQK